MKRFLLIQMFRLVAAMLAHPDVNPNLVWIIADDQSPEQSNLRQLT